MTLDEMRTVARIIGTADGGCSTCVGDLVRQMREAFPQFEFVIGDEVEEPDPQWLDCPEFEATITRIEISVDKPDDNRA